MQDLRARWKISNTAKRARDSRAKGPSVGKSLVPGGDWVVGWTGQRSGGVSLSLSFFFFFLSTYLFSCPGSYYSLGRLF